MKTKMKTVLLLLAMVLSVGAKAQTSVNLQYINDTTGTGLPSGLGTYCAAPVSVAFYVSGDAIGYNYLTDSMEMHFFWDDGTDSIFKVPLYSSVPDYFGAYPAHTYVSAGIYNVMVTATGPDGSADTLINTPVSVSASCVLIEGDCYYDNNSNCIFDAGDDTLLTSVSITDASGAFIAMANTDAMSHYAVYIPPGLTGLTITPQATLYSSVTCPASGSYTFSSTGPMTFDFGISCTSSSFDLFADQAGGHVGVPGNTGTISFYAGNLSCVDVPASTVTLTLDPDVSYVSTLMGTPPSTVSGSVLTWTAPMPGAYSGWWGGSLWSVLNVMTSTGATVLDTAFFNVTITPVAGDSNPADNSTNFYKIIGGPYDPNSKQVEPAGLGAGGNIAPAQELTYTVNFQNTGTTSAINVHVMDTLDTDLDLSTFRIVASSHTMNPYFYEGNIVRFDYPNINLVDSSTSEPLSHGWVIYKIKPKNGLADGTLIKNTGHIYFDYNPAIVTNTTLNTIDVSMGIEENEEAVSSLVYPNPANDRITIEFGKKLSGTLSVMDMTGKVVKIVALDNDDHVAVDLKGLSAGLYGLMIPGIQMKQSRMQVIR